jgi:hypothetical protein
MIEAPQEVAAQLFRAGRPPPGRHSAEDLEAASAAAEGGVDGDGQVVFPGDRDGLVHTGERVGGAGASGDVTGGDTLCPLSGEDKSRGVHACFSRSGIGSQTLNHSVRRGDSSFFARVPAGQGATSRSPSRSPTSFVIQMSSQERTLRPTSEECKFRPVRVIPRLAAGGHGTVGERSPAVEAELDECVGDRALWVRERLADGTTGNGRRGRGEASSRHVRHPPPAPVDWTGSRSRFAAR